MDRKAIARETLDIMEKGYYEAGGKKIEIMALQEYSLRKSFLLTPEQGRELLKDCSFLSGSAVSGQTISGRAASGHSASRTFEVWNCSTVDAILDLTSEGKKDIAVLNFASAKNPGGGFINGAMAQEESLAASSSLYKTLIAHEEYYTKNRACGTMMYTHHAIYSPEVPFQTFVQTRHSIGIDFASRQYGTGTAERRKCLTGRAGNAGADAAGSGHFCQPELQTFDSGGLWVRRVPQ